MELYFNHNDEKILNFNDIVRKEITKTYRKMESSSGNSDVAIYYIIDSLKEMYENRELVYFYYTNVMLTTTFMMLENIKVNNLTTIEDFITYDILTNLIENPNDLIYYLKCDAGVTEDLIRYTVMFDELSILGKKIVTQNNKSKYEELLKLSSIFGLDILRYSNPGDPEEYLNYFMETLDIMVLEPNLVIEDIVNYMKHLYIYDKQTYINNLKEMSKIFYIWTKYQNNIDEIDDKKIIDCLSIIEKNDIEKLCDISIQNDELLYFVIDGYCNYSTNIGLKVKNKYIEKEIIYDYMKDKMPDSLKDSIQYKKK